MNKNMVIGIEGLVGAGKTSICKKMLEYIPNSALLHGGNIYRAIVYVVLQSGISLADMKESMKNIDANALMQKLKLEIQLEDRESVIYWNGQKIEEEKLQSKESSMAVSMMSNVANNHNLYAFGKNIIEQWKKKYNVILSSRDIMKMYPETDYHFFITASLEERVRRKYIQYKGEISKDAVKQNIVKRDELQKASGYYEEYEKTQKIDVTDCKTIEESTKKVLQYIKIPVMES